MSWFTRVLSCALTGVVALLAALVLTSAGAGPYDRGPWGRTTPYRAVAEEAERLQNLEREREETFVALRRRAEVMDAVIEGRCSLPEAAADFWELNRSMSAFHWENFRRFYPGATEGERCCRHVIRHVACRLEDAPDRGEAVVRRLEAELEECLRRGPVRLPGVDDAPTP
ncbi:MAG TPA: hypothetical protein VFE78_22350 [Gemmataceae bacterium]|nr:hypothetical protein [Gemmataceae bacterium]